MIVVLMYGFNFGIHFILEIIESLVQGVNRLYIYSNIWFTYGFEDLYQIDNLGWVNLCFLWWRPNWAQFFSVIWYFVKFILDYISTIASQGSIGCELLANWFIKIVLSVWMSVTVRVASTLQILVTTLSPLELLASTSHMTLVQLLGILTALNSTRSSHRASYCASKLGLPRYLPIIH